MKEPEREREGEQRGESEKSQKNFSTRMYHKNEDSIAPAIKMAFGCVSMYTYSRYISKLHVNTLRTRIVRTYVLEKRARNWVDMSISNEQGDEWKRAEREVQRRAPPRRDTKKKETATTKRNRQKIK